MAQQLIVEGNDAIPLARLCQIRKLPPPLGYENKEKFKDKFVAVAGGYHKALAALEIAIQQSDLTNIGIIVDADDAGASARWQAIRGVLAGKYASEVLDQADKQLGAKVVIEDKLPRVGVWIMPDNFSNGYLETFLAKLIPTEDALWAHTQLQIADLFTLPFCELTPSKADKAQLHTWLAWKSDPGKPFGQAIDAGYFDSKSLVVQPFLDWFKSTFELASAK